MRPVPPLDGTLLLTGASAGIGRELARQLAPRAGCLVLVARRMDRLEALRQELTAARSALRVIVAECDLADPASADRMLDAVLAEAGRVDVLINNAGLGEQQLYWRADWQRVRRIVEVNVLALLQLTHRLLPGMVERGGGGVMNIGSGAGFTLIPGAGTYTGSKYFVRGFTEALRTELEGTGVVVTNVAPGPVRTEFGEAAGMAPLGSGPPGPLWISAEQCAREAIRGFERGDALVLPGRRYRFLMRLVPLTPGWVLRKAFEPMARQMRKLGKVPTPPSDP